VDVAGEYRIAADAATVWQRLNDPAVLERCVPGCNSMVRTGDNLYECEIVARYGPVKAAFKTTLEVSNINAPVSYTLSGRGQGGAAGFGEGSADVALEPVPEGTCVRYSARFNAGGRIAQVGSRLLASTTRKLAEQFFAAFAASFGDTAAAGEEEGAA
jgi:carbon monoxide dehydrogenase subunit G